MDSNSVILIVAVVLIGLALGAGFAWTNTRRTKSKGASPRPGIDYAPGVGDDDTVPRDTPRRSIETVEIADLNAVPTDAVEEIPSQSDAVWETEIPDPVPGRLHRLRARLARSQNIFGRGVLALLSGGNLDDSTWEDIEAALLSADLGVPATTELINKLKIRVSAEGTTTPERAKVILREELVNLINPNMNRSMSASADERPAVIMVVGVNGTGKTTTVGKLGRLFVAEQRVTVLAAADTFRAAAADQLQTWGDRVGAAVVRGPEGGDPASVAFEATGIAIEAQADVLVIDTAGRLHTKTGLMDELGKVKRVIEKQSPIDEILLVIDATTGQNGLVQARVFSDVVDITGVVLTKLDGTAKGGIIISIQKELGVPVKLIGLGEGPDDLAPFDVEQFVSAILD